MSMIQPATVPAAAKLLLAIDPQVANGDAAAFDAQLSALLTANFSPPADIASTEAEAGSAAAAVAELPFKTQLRPASGKPDGKAGGRHLPEHPALAAFAAMLKQLRGSDETGGGATTDQHNAAAPLNSAMSGQQPVPACAVSAADNPALVPVTPANETLSLPFATPVPPTAFASNPVQPLAAEAPVPQRIFSAQVEPGSGAPATEGSAAPSDQTAPAPVQSAGARPAAPGSPAPELPQIRPETQPLVIQSGLTTRILQVLRSQAPSRELTKLQTMAIEQGRTGEAALQIAKVPVRQAPEVPAAPAVTIFTPVGAGSPVTMLEPARARSGNAEAPQEALLAAIAPLDAAPLPAANSAPALDATPAGATSPSPAPAPSRTPDFAALIDRLVEARAAAQTSLEPHIVNAAIQHADFGEVSLQFRQDAAGLSVVMASADPDLAKALQMAAAAGGSFAGQFAHGGEGSAPSPRQASDGQPSGDQASASNGQTQSQTRQRAPDQTSGGANPSRSPSKAPQPQRSGIFA